MLILVLATQSAGSASAGWPCDSFISVIEIAGKFLTNKRNRRKNNAKLPAVIAPSIQVGE